ncbi:MAG TPA: KH domain-containing protein [Ignavibacteriaceae bacterium]|nr:KH domain-containing protein [Ignavibacteriaceae bacterium]
MKKFIELVIKELVDNPEKVKVEEIAKDKNSIEFTVEVAADDIGKVIGKKGKNINALRTLLTAVGAKEHHRTTLQVIE